MSLWGLKYAQKADAFASTPWWRLEALEVIRRLPAKGRVLDFACNTGKFIKLCLQRGLSPDSIEFIGVDINPHAVELAAARVPLAVFDTSVDDFSDGSMDYVAIIHALPQIQDVPGVLSVLWGKMAHGAGISVVLHNKWYDWMMRPLNKLKGYKGDETIQQHFSRGELLQVMWDAGFVVEECYWFGEGRIPFLKHRIIYHGRKPL